MGTCAEEDLIENFQNENVKVGTSEYKFAECPICKDGESCEDPRFYCAEQHVFCRNCLEEFEKFQTNFNCPACRGVYAASEMKLLGKLAQLFVKIFGVIVVFLFM